MRNPASTLRGRLASGVLAAAVCLAFAGAAWAQQARTPRIWDIPFGTHVRDLPAAAFVDPACGGNGGPPGRPLDGFEDFALCPAEAATGLYEVWFIYDDTVEYVGLARRDPSIHGATQILQQPVILSFLIGADGRVRGYRIFTDPRAEPGVRIEANSLSSAFKSRLAGAQWTCADLPREPGETPISGLYVKEQCVADSGGRHAVVEAHHYYRPGQSLINPFNNRVNVNVFESSARTEVVQVDPLPPLPPAPAAADAVPAAA